MKRIKNKLNNALNFVNKGHLKQAEILYLECLDKIEDKQSSIYKQAMHGLGFIKSELGQFKEASKLYIALLYIARDKGDKEDEALAYHQLGMVERLSGNIEKALHYFAKEYEIYHDTFPEFHLGFAVNLYERGKTCLLQNELTEAQYFIEDSLNHGEKTGEPIVVGCTHRDLGHIFQLNGEKKKAMIHYKYALDAFQRAEDSQAIKDIERKMANL
ncbi:tetratricopeptide repeat protein [Oceanobacillus senegalensis]|uniref:tetratricopeptide repeat protein n=1 Tax=Oceanobacillus senegalensis TaxID=1936063 RepID=UPI000A30A739|nr:tetratricopeptide repeat protein [Oceanobacillus senegalensis]